MLGNPSLRTFEGVRFFLFGFDPIKEQKVRSKLLAGGGVDVGQYSQNCTHFVVDKIAFDDPICEAARKDGKMVLTALWVDHSADIGMPLEPDSIMYRPLKDLNGIPGAKSLVFCLTGYQRQDRDNIMTMVGLMGAEFSKPLVAHRVTHLICYKFEGDKYELAKKLRSIKLVNHRWLEDCLKDWQILPEANYNKSGYEMELMQAEAKDSEDVREETIVKKFGVTNIHRSPYSITTAVPGAHESRKLVDDGSNVQAELTVPVGSINVPNSLGISDIGTSIAIMNKSEQVSKIGNSVTPYNIKTVMPEAHKSLEVLKEGLIGNGIVSKSEQVLKSCNSAAQMLAHEDGINITDATSGKLPDFNCRTPNGKNVKNDDTSSSGTAEGTLPSEGRFSTSVYSRRTSRNLGDTSSKGSGSSIISIGKPSVTDHLCPSSLKVEQEKRNIGPDFIEDTSKPTILYRGDKCSVALPQKRTLDGSCATAKSLKICKESKSCGVVSPQTGVKIVRPMSPTGGLNETDNSCFFHSESEYSRVKTPKLDALEKHGCSDALNQSHTSPKFSYEMPFSSFMVSGSGQNHDAVEKKSPVTFQRLSSPLSRTSPDAVGGFVVGKSTDALGEVDQPKNHQQDVEGSVVSNITSNNNTSNGPSEGDLVGNINFIVKPVRKTITAKKCLGSRPKLASGTNQKCSIYLDEGTSRNTIELCTSKEVNGNSTLSKDLLISPPTHQEHEKVQARDAAQFGGDSEMADETEVPDEKVEEFKNGHYEVKVREPTNKDDKDIKGKIKTVQHITKDCEASVISSEEGKKRTKQENEAVLVESKSSGYGMQNNKSKETSVLGKTKISIRAETMETLHDKGEETNCVKDDMVKSEGKKGTEQERADVLAEGKKGTKQENADVRIESKSRGYRMQKNKNKETSVVGKTKTEVSVRTETCETPHHMGEETQCVKDDMVKSEGKIGTEEEHADVLAETNLKDGAKKRKSKATRHVVGKISNKEVFGVTEETGARDGVGVTNNAQDDKVKGEDEKRVTGLLGKSKRISVPKNKLGHTNEAEKENMEVVEDLAIDEARTQVDKSTIKSYLTPVKKKSKFARTNPPVTDRVVLNQLQNEPVCFILSGSRFQRKEYQKIIRNLKGRFCRDSHKWSYEATHFIAPDPIRRTEKFFAAVASGRCVLKPDYLTASSQAGKFLSEEPFEWYNKGLSKDGAINLEAPRKWRRLRERTGHGALHGMRIIIYGDCIAPPLDTLKRVVKAGGGIVLATSPPYSRFLNCGVDFVIVSPGMPCVDVWVQEFLKHEIPCVVADYLVEYVCKPGYSLEKHVLYNSHAWAERSFAQLKSRAEEVVMDLTPPHAPNTNDISCEICGSRDRGKEMLICGNEDGSMGCGIGTYIDCFDPPFEEVPEEHWFCPNCIKSKISSSAAKKRRKGDNSLKRK